ncbi:hypothetical protein, conserved [Entamoeba dispar SAW760]|uniref:Uncharacterized protein n=1 Tax=Entamoeba dispar (strain ATCC PRA-260 / SAW760) TaxID=370354 RepID=B0EHV7_ENTDS|nr:uncharacterized protein EDI_044570 [Entamoeba dispar SAW760]EDR25901.1 hypothetical protein, conserved [Entamoeba dispar SAW760]|eukprot:EDR25901.1 hypothetical protein, conserved [Entamoeba dispar SAW760]
MTSSNPTPHVYQELDIHRTISESVEDLNIREDIDQLEIYEHIRRIKDPEHPSVTLEQLKVISPDLINVDDKGNHIIVKFTPTVDNCTMATLIGLTIRTKLMRILPPRIKLDIYLTKGTHQTEEDVNKQLNDKERIAAALEKQTLLQLVNKCLI